MSDLRVLFLCARIGDGHVRAAQAVEAALRRSDSTLTTEILDPFQAACPHLVRLGVGGYLRGLWGRRYRSDAASQRPEWGWKTFAALATPPLLRRVAGLRPHVLVSTYPPISRLIAQLRSYGHSLPPALGVLTDFAAPALDCANALDRYMVSTLEAASELVEAGWDADRIEISGVPVDPRFAHGLTPQTARTTLGLDPELPTVLLMNGGAGVGEFQTALAGLEATRIPAQAIVVAGRNRRALNSVMRRPRSTRLRVLARGHVDNVGLLMDAADFIIGKPGGLTVSEALVKGAPFLCVAALPGAEQDNLRTLVRWGIAVVASTPAAVAQVSRQWLCDRPTLDGLRDRARNHARPDAAFQCADAVVRLAHGVETKDFPSPCLPTGAGPARTDGLGTHAAGYNRRIPETI